VQGACFIWNVLRDSLQKDVIDVKLYKRTGPDKCILKHYNKLANEGSRGWNCEWGAELTHVVESISWIKRIWNKNIGDIGRSCSTSELEAWDGRRESQLSLPAGKRRTRRSSSIFV
jgi:hypothetical protein